MTPQWIARRIVEDGREVAWARAMMDGKGVWWVRVAVKYRGGAGYFYECEAKGRENAESIAASMQDDMLRELVAEGAWEP